MALPGGVILPPSVGAFVTDASPVRITTGEAGAEVWRYDFPGGEQAYLKHGRGDVANAIADELARLRWLSGQIPCARELLYAENEGAAWLLTKAVPGKTAGARLAHDREAAPGVIAGMVRFIHALHALPTRNCPFDASVLGWLPDARRRVAAGLVDQEDFDDDHRSLTAAEVLDTVEKLAPHAAGRVVVHGDLTLGNLLTDDTGRVTGCIDVGRLGIGDPYQDIALAWRDLGGFGTAEQQLVIELLDMGPVDQQRMLLHRALDELF